ncbi:MAG: phage holin family protein [Brooklawnia sp.]|uniref:phage holin family protein n=1 Tax=Brooklawnia sp. TaxID=2699740 RepID=UPI003C7370E9
MNLLLRIVATALAVWVAGWLVPGIQVGGTAATGDPSGDVIVTLLLVSLVFGLVNSFVKPVVQVLSGCFILLTFGLFLLVINAAMLMLTSWIMGQFGIAFTVTGWGAALLGSIIISLVSALINGITGAGKGDQRRPR